MGAAPFDLFGLSEPRIETILLVAVRATFMLSLLPVWSASQIPSQVKVGFGLLLSFVIAQVVPTLAAPLDLGHLTLAIVAQAFVGLIYGFVASLIFAGIQFAGEILDIQIGFAAVNIINPTTQQQVTIVGEFELTLATILYLALDADHFLLAGIAGSFNLVALPYANPDPQIAHSIVGFFSQSLFIVFEIAAPISITLFLVNVSLALMARVAPQMNVFIVGLPLQIGVGLIMIVVTFPLLGAVLPGIFEQLPPELDAVLRRLAVAPAGSP